MPTPSSRTAIASGSTFVQITNLGITAIGSLPGGAVRVAQLIDDKPVAGAEIELIDEPCGKRRVLRREDWAEVAQELRNCGKEVVFSTLALIEAESELATMGRIVRETEGLIEANDYACITAMGGRPFVIGPHLNVYNEPTLKFLARHGAKRWVAPVELPLAIVAALAELRPPHMEVEMFGYGRLPLAFSARCFTARARGRPGRGPVGDWD